MTDRTKKPAGRQPPAKGEYGGECQRGACANRGARWFSATSGTYYCESCARSINDYCRRNGYDPLCELQAEPPAPDS